MEIIEISYEEGMERLRCPHNPPDTVVSEKEFDEEYYALYDLVEPIMASQGVNDAYGQGDYYLEPSISRSRGLGLEISNPEIISTQLLQKLNSVIATRAPDWEIYLRSANFDFGVFIGPSIIRMHRNSPKLLCWLSR